jgi:predicted SnoaL-like aldol condensation-catalyzing enzyme
MSPSPPDDILDQNRRLLLRFFDEAWNQCRRETVKKFFAKRAIFRSGNREAHGPDEFLHFYDILSAEFSNFSIKPIVSLAEGDLVCVHWSLDCLYTATRTPVHVTGMSIVRIKDGQFIEAWQNWDAAGVTQQIPGIVLP